MLSPAEPSDATDGPPMKVRVADPPGDFGRTLDLLAELLVDVAIRELSAAETPPASWSVLCN